MHVCRICQCVICCDVFLQLGQQNKAGLMKWTKTSFFLGKLSSEARKAQALLACFLGGVWLRTWFLHLLETRPNNVLLPFVFLCRSHCIAVLYLELAIQTRLASNWWQFPCLSCLSTGVVPHAQLGFYFMSRSCQFVSFKEFTCSFQ